MKEDDQIFDFDYVKEFPIIGRKLKWKRRLVDLNVGFCFLVREGRLC